ncbi:MAG: tetratricopeptide repeat protein [Myxococcota bacterium]|nr:tetratricopeptide repeat protein [Myxococcota bacterium]
MTGSADGRCRACGFVNPRAWRGCARCGRPLGSATPWSRSWSLGLPSGSPPTSEPEERTEVTGAPEMTDEHAPPPSIEAEPASSDAAPSSFGAADRAEPPLVGRVEAASAISSAIEAAFSVGRPAVVLVIGERGSGRTRLLVHASEVAAALDPSTRVLYGACREGDDEHAPFSRLLLDRFDIVPTRSPASVRAQMATAVAEALGTSEAAAVAEATHLLGHLAGVPFPDSPFLTSLAGRPEELRRRTRRALRELFEADARARPLLVLLDDLHRASEVALEMLRELLGIEAHVAIVVTGEPSVAERLGPIPPHRMQSVVPLPPLDEAEVAAMVRVLLPALDAVPEALGAAIAHRSGGRPAAVVQLVEELVEAGLFVAGDDASLRVDLGRLDRGDLPVTADDAVLSRLERLDPFDRATLERAAVVGETFWDGALLAQMRTERAPPDTETDPTAIWTDDDVAMLDAVLGRLVRRGFVLVYEPCELPAMRQYAFASSRVRDLLYDRMDPALRVARHAAVAGWLAVAAETGWQGVAALIAPHLERAGLRERAGRAYLEAAHEERARLRTETALAYVTAALGLLAEDDVARRLDALHEHGSLLTTLGRYDEALASFDRMLRLAWRLGARGKAAAALNRIARVHRRRGQDERARVLLERALELFRGAADARGVAATLDDLAQVLRVRGELEAAEHAANEALALRRAQADRRGEAVSLHTLGMVRYARGALPEAERLCGEALAIRHELGDLEGTVESLNALGIFAFERGDIAAAIERWEQALQGARSVGDGRTQCFLHNNVGEALARDGRLEEARARLLEARRLAESLGDLRAATEVERNLGLVLMRLGDEASEATLRNALALATQYGGREAIALAHRALGDLRARTLFDASGDVDRRAEDSYLASIDIFRELGNDKEVARSLIALGRHLVERGDLETARERLREARALLRPLGLPELEQVERTLAEIGPG